MNDNLHLSTVPMVYGTLPDRYDKYDKSERAYARLFMYIGKGS